MEERREKVSESLEQYKQRFSETYKQKCAYEFENLESPPLLLASSSNQVAVGFSNNKLLYWSPSSTESIDTPHHGTIESLAISPTGQFLASGSSDKSIKLFKDKKELRHYADAHGGMITALAFSSDEKLFGSGSDDMGIRVWSPDSQHWVHDIGVHHKTKINSLCFTIDHKLVSGSHDGMIKVWNLETKPVQLIFEHSAHKGPVKSLSAALKAPVFLTCGSQDGNVNVFNTSNPKHEPILKILNPHKTLSVHSVSVNSDGKQALMADFFKKEVILWNVENNTEIRSFNLQNSTIDAIGFTDDAHFITLQRNQKIKKWQIDGDGDEYDLQKDHEIEPSDEPYDKAITHMACVPSQSTKYLVENGYRIIGESETPLNFDVKSPERINYIACSTGQNLVTASDNKIFYWDIALNALRRVVDRPFDDLISALTISEDGRNVAAGSAGSKSKYWHVSKKGQFDKMDRFDSLPKYGRVQATFILRSLKLYIVVYVNKAITVWNYDSKRQVTSWEDDIPGDFYSADVCKNSKYVICGSENMIKIWNIETHEIAHRISNPHFGQIKIISAGSLYFISSGIPDRSMKLWSFKEFTEVHHFTNLHADAVTSVSLDEKLNLIQTSSMDGTVNLWALDTKYLKTNQRNPKRPIITAMAISDTTDEVMCAYSNGEICKWSLDKYNLIKRYKKAHKGWILSLAASSDFKLIASGDLKNKLKIWDNQTHTLLHELTDTSDLGSITALAFAQDSSKVLISAIIDMFQNFSVVLWDVGTYKKMQQFNIDAKRPITSIAINGKKYMTTGPAHSSIQSWDWATNPHKMLNEIPKDKEIDMKTVMISANCDEIAFTTINKEVYSLRLGDKPVLQFEHPEVNSIYNLAISPSGKYIASYGTENGRILIWNKANKKIEHEFYAIPYKAVICSRISHDEKFIVVACSDRSITLFDGRPNQYNVLYRFEKAHTDYITSLEISLDNKILVSTSKDKSVKLWDIPSRSLLHHYQKAFDCTVDSAAISPDNDKVIATGFKSSKIQVWNMGENHNLVQTIESEHKGYVKAAFFSHDGNLMISYGQTDTVIKVWETETWKITSNLTNGHTDNITCAVMTEDCQYIASGSLDKSINLWNITSKKFHKFENAHKAGVQSIAISGRYKYIVSGSRDREMKLWGIKSRKCIHVFANDGLPPHLGSINSLSIALSGKYIVSSGSVDSKMRVWIAENSEFFHVSREGLTNPINAICLANTAEKILTVSYKEMRVYRLEGKKCEQEFPKEEHAEQITAVAISTDASTVISVSADKSMIMWVNLKPICAKALAHDKPIETVVLSRDVKTIVTGSADRSVKIWTIEGLKFDLAHHFKNAHNDTVKSVAISSNGKYAVSGSLDATMKLWDIEGKKLVHHFSLAHGDAVNCVQISADNRFIVSGSSDRKLRVWNLYTEQLIHEFRNAHSDAILTVNISPDSKLIVSASADKTIKLWSFEALRLIHNYAAAHDAEITSVAISGENRYIVSASTDKTVKLWKIPSLIVLSKSFSIYFALKPELHDDDIILPFMWNSMHLAALFNKFDFTKDNENEQLREPDFMGNLPMDYILSENVEYNEFVEEKIKLLKDIRSKDHKSFLKLMKAMRLDYIHFLRKTSLSNPKLVKRFLALCIDEIDDKHIRQEEVSSDLQLKIYGMPTDEFVESDKPIITSAIQEKLVMEKPLRTYKLRYITTTMPLDLDLGSENIKALLIYLSEQSQRFIFEDKFVLFILSYLWKKTKPYQRVLFWLYTIFMILVSAESTNRDPGRNGLNYFIVIYSCFLMIFEIVQLTAQFTIDFWSFFDWTTHALVISTMIICINDPLTPYLPYLRAVYFFSGYFRWLAYLRIFDGIRALIRSIIEILKDMSSFLLILVFTIFCYTFILEGFIYGDNQDFFKHMFDSYQFLYNSELDGADVGLQALQVIFPFVINVVFLNMLITIMGDTFDRTQEKITYSDNVEKVEIILEIVHLVIKMRAIKNFILHTIFNKNTYDIKRFFRWIKSLFHVSRNKKKMSTEKRRKLVKSIIRELKQTDKTDNITQLQYILKCDYKAEEETDDEWSGKLRHLLKKNLESIERGELELQAELGNKLTELSGSADTSGKERMEKLEANINAVQKDIEFMGEQLNKLFKMFSSKIKSDTKPNEIKAQEIHPSEIKIKTKEPIIDTVFS